MAFPYVDHHFAYATKHAAEASDTSKPATPYAWAKMLPVQIEE